MDQPLYVYSAAKMRAQIRSLRAALTSLGRIYFAMKANWSVCRLFGTH